MTTARAQEIEELNRIKREIRQKMDDSDGSFVAEYEINGRRAKYFDPFKALMDIEELLAKLKGTGRARNLAKIYRR
jgi:hypothetical protein